MNRRGRRPALRGLVLLLFVATLAGPAPALDRLGFAAGEMQGPGVSARDIKVVLDLASGPRGELRIGRLELAGFDQPFTDVQLQCGRIELPPRPLACLDGRLRSAALTGLLGTRGLGLSLRRQADGAWQLTLPSQALAQGRVELHIVLAEDHWTARGTLQQVESAALLAVFASLLPAGEEASAQGRLNLDFNLKARRGEWPQGRLELSSPGLTATNAPSTLASDTLAGRLRLDLSRAKKRLRVRAAGQLTEGYAYVEPLLQHYTKHPLSFQADVYWSPESGAVELSQLDWDQRAVLRAQASARWQPAASPPLQSLNLTIESAELPGLYTQLLLPLATGTALDELESSGALSGRLEIDRGRPTAIDLQFKAVHLDDQQRRFAIYGLDGQLAWHAKAPVPASALEWDGAYWARMPFGAGRWSFQATPDGLQTLAPVAMDFFDGRLQISRLDASNLTGEEPELKLQAALEPVTLGLLTVAFGWPSFPGDISGELPLLHYRKGELVVDGQIDARVFGGQLTIDQARLTGLNGPVPRLQADLRLRDLDLALFTSVFDIGRIEGPLNAELLGLQLEAWQPVAFAAHLYTPPGTSARRRISQRAVDSIARVGGGGAAGALSTGFLRFFKNFAYQRIDWSCELRDNVCRMGGGEVVEGGGYRIVEGRGIPRIDVVGHARRVSWPDLLTQLTAVSASPGARVE